jgi:putative alpha-1,2-mannosidase
VFSGVRQHCIKQLYNYFLKRSENWRNLYDSKSTFMRPKLKMELYSDLFKYILFCESNAWQYFWSVPQNVEGLIKTVGGRCFLKS